MPDAVEEALLTPQPRRQRPCRPAKPWPSERLHRFHARAAAQALAQMMAGYYPYGVGPTGGRYTIRGIATLFETPASTAHRMIASVDEEEALAAARRFGLVRRSVDLSDVAGERAGDSQVVAALAGDGDG